MRTAFPVTTCAHGDPVAQYDIYPNPSHSSDQGIPFVVVIQSDLLDALATRLVIPLATPDYAGPAPEKLCPSITVQGQTLRALTHFTAPLPTRQLKRRVENLALQSNALVTALDMVLSGF